MRTRGGWKSALAQRKREEAREPFFLQDLSVPIKVPYLLALHTHACLALSIGGDLVAAVLLRLKLHPL